jgi:hypothetical protein
VTSSSTTTGATTAPVYRCTPATGEVGSITRGGIAAQVERAVLGLDFELVGSDQLVPGRAGHGLGQADSSGCEGASGAGQSDNATTHEIAATEPYRSVTATVSQRTGGAS